MSDIEVVGRIERRRIWSAREKAALLAEVDAEGGKVRLVARRHRISESLLYSWRSARKAAAIATGAPESVTFVPVGVIESADSGGLERLALPNPEPSRPATAKRERSRSRCRTARGFASTPWSTRRLWRGCCAR